MVVDWLNERIFLGGPFDFVLTGAFVIFLALAWLSQDRRARLVLLAATIAIYPIGAIKGALS